MRLVIIFGPQAVGKMTVGYELEKITDLKLFHNHMTIELILNFFEYETPEAKRLIKLFRDEIFNAVANSDQPGLIFTSIFNFDDPVAWDRLEEISHIFTSKNADVCLVELETDIETRIERNKTEFRLAHKPSKRDVEATESRLVSSAQTHRLNSAEGEIQSDNYLRIDNTGVAPGKVAIAIKERFKL